MDQHIEWLSPRVIPTTSRASEDCPNRASPTSADTDKGLLAPSMYYKLHCLSLSSHSHPRALGQQGRLWQAGSLLLVLALVLEGNMEAGKFTQQISLLAGEPDFELIAHTLEEEKQGS